MKRTWLVTALVIALLLAGCGGDDKSEPEATPTSEKPVIKLAVLPWLSNQANVTVAKILLEEQMGYSVELVPVQASEQWDSVASGETHAQMEIWLLSSQDEINTYVVDQQSIEDLGSLGPVGEGGWYVPVYMLDEHPTLRTWEGLQDPDNVALFVTEETGTKGRLLSGDPEWVHSQYAETLIRNLDLDLQIVYAGSEAEELAVLGEAYENEEPILLYFWTPHWALGVYDLFHIQLPAYSEECYADLDAIDCAYPPEPLHKVVWSGLKDYAPDVYQFLKNFEYSNRDQIQIMVKVQMDGVSVEEAARAWIEANETTWRAWIP